MKRTIVIGLILAAACMAIPASAQITSNGGPLLEALPPAPGLFTAAGPLFPVPSQWSATVSYAVTTPSAGLWTYWYRVEHTGGLVAPIQSLKSATLNLDPSLIVNSGLYEFGQYDLGPGQSWAAEVVGPGDSAIRWSYLGSPQGGLNQLTTGDVIYLWVRSANAPGQMVNLSLQDGTIGQTRVIGPSPVPEPMSMVLVGMGLSAIAGLRRKHS